MHEDYTPGPWKIHPYYGNIIISDNLKLFSSYNQYKEVFVARNSNRLPDYDRLADQNNMKRIVACFNFCEGYLSENLNSLSLLRVINNNPDKECKFSHNKTPWVLDPKGDIQVLSFRNYKYGQLTYDIIVKPDSEYKYDEHITLSNCHRIVTCVNFCEGYTNTELSEMKLHNILLNMDTLIY